MKRFEKVQAILEAAVAGTEIEAHGNFWRSLTLEQFKVADVFGEQLLVVGSAEESNLIKALEGRAPFGTDTGTPDAIYERMPVGFAPVSPENIAVIRRWIDDGCPDEEETKAASAGGGTKIIDLMNVPPEEHDLDWLKAALQSAIELELATLPPYLCAMWSIDETDPNAAYPVQSLRQIVIEEMRHMGLACNLLTTLGGTPQINVSGHVPEFPGELPGGVKPGLMVSLAKLSPEQLAVFLEIELPETPPIMPTALKETFPTIGAFYDAILAALQNLSLAAFTGRNQLTALGLRPVRSLADAETAVGIIKIQGEGTAQSPEEQPGLSEPDLAHYYRFREILNERRFVKNAAGQWVNGEAIPFPKVYPMATIPKGGYAEFRDFDRIYTHLLNSLQKAWETSDNIELAKSRPIMISMKAEAKRLMQMPIDAQDLSKGNFGPSFRLLVE